SKNWKFNSKDLIERELRSEYLSAFVKAFSGTATEISPWYIVPADTKWYTRYLVSEILLDVFKDINPQYPPLPESEKIQIPIYMEKLNKEK
ncbi:MAG: polyphosphate kinase 2 family protein, partial [Christensenellaceae bacterium]|nr:polyphosphate kinase 2 family protein [Christensenellaceae bacterium]